MKVLTLIGARPQFIKAAVVSKTFLEQGVEEIILHSGQHYDKKMSNVFWEELNIPKPFSNFNIGSGNHGEQTGNIMIQVEKVLLSNKDIAALMVYGDTNTTLAGALVASKLQIPVIHVESGLRSHNREMPEEINRILTDHISNILFCPSNIAVENLKKEGIVKGVYNVGDVMYDAMKLFIPIAEKKSSIKDIIKHKNFTLFTLHRPKNTDDFSILSSIINELSIIDSHIYWPVHPRNKKYISELKLPKNIHIIEPLSYFEMLLALKYCKLVITDSGGLQKEAYWSKKPCFTLRESTEWIETLYNNWNTLATAGDLLLKIKNSSSGKWVPLYGDGTSSQQIVSIIKKVL